MAGVRVVSVAPSRWKGYETEDFRFSYPAAWGRIRGVEFPLAEQTGASQIGVTRWAWTVITG